MISATATRPKSTAGKDGIADEESHSNSDNTSDGDSEHEGITSLPSYLQQHISKVTSRSNLQSDSGLCGATGASKVPVGLWEQHTKGTATPMALCAVSFPFCVENLVLKFFLCVMSAGVGSRIMQRMGYRK
jgi:hypothetical protein